MEPLWRVLFPIGIFAVVYLVAWKLSRDKYDK